MAVIASTHARAFQRKDFQAHNVVRSILPRATTTENGQPVVNPLPVSVRVLTAFFVILGVLLLGIATWRIVVWKRRKAMTASQKFRKDSFIPSEKIRPIAEGKPMEKQEVLVILPMEPPATVQHSAKWVPQIPKGHDGSAVVDVKVSMGEAARSPPPTYTAYKSPASTPSTSPRPPALNLPILTVTHEDNSNMLSVPAVASPVPSPRRTSSFLKEAPAENNLKPKPSIKGQKLPRKMLVEHTFIPSLADELSVKVGEVLTMLEEYEDEWCLVERLGSRSGERGVVPRFCLKERPRGHKRGQSSTSVRSGASSKTQ
ncbi:hypothetical protein BD309DRAFT_561939 [Dichomitus squalens]|uniref:SH3 domain-containing protein n=1 Tax=Dichomitus squalens TaxID=114155 RepID=A0A4V2K534_9APHY|nr:uncharacterized protein DICSQDRAFT_152276 [Dichomitus squalens LYAD-421 SS1]EJF66312.1 hypothetical protein DICSQDRAFT_152276 [Dichomitus squalens LYAD-421 SS1]TBU35425.1 hypothetical protein BD311DRAFT_2147 [Dichomitus squalens]TBU46853.1 hypothetical protein BD309DRAFT_561939 [Dichomitus squalens]TBU65265.1 hypothetical protein BD310DRAFT_1045 [Dichomitus squalens]